MMRTDVRFALLNLIPAVLYAGFIIMSFTMMGGPTAAAWWLACSLGAGLWLATGILRTVALRRNWFALGTGALLARLTASVVVGAFVVQFAVRVVIETADMLGFYRLPPSDTYGVREAIVYAVQVALILWLWVAAWAGWHLLRHRRQSEMARLRAESQSNALELDALRARLNPHFVFNALNNVRALINEEPGRAREVVTRLSNILRHALEHSQRESASLGEELAVVDDYLAVESVHYEERLKVHRDIARDALDAQLPPMLLQLLVENAIKHGIARTPGGGELGVSAWRHQGKLAIEVSNPGRVEHSGRGHGVGLAYLRARLAREPGSDFHLQQNGPRVLARLEIAQ
ncbi:signal transduction histidine kinase [Lysobacter niabensis]|uniref:Signal transduction histidine kinase n=1 Tax=Agrilutibacter niabensis TaxID=380628 RepID=A0ABU1VQC9_9GAMM|nr:histidine kinase [Lysobacter niabensis]MDR7099687.1 signal transduction histidine kinase [Lysobacter niabensis]